MIDLLLLYKHGFLSFRRMISCKFLGVSLSLRYLCLLCRQLRESRAYQMMSGRWATRLRPEECILRLLLSHIVTWPTWSSRLGVSSMSHWLVNSFDSRAHLIILSHEVALKVWHATLVCYVLYRCGRQADGLPLSQGVAWNVFIPLVKLRLLLNEHLLLNNLLLVHVSLWSLVFFMHDFILLPAAIFYHQNGAMVRVVDLLRVP